MAGFVINSDGELDISEEAGTTSVASMMNKTEDERLRLSAIPILPLKIVNTLFRGGIYTLGRLSESSESEVRAIPGIGDASIIQVKKTLDRFGMSLMPSAPESVDERTTGQKISDSWTPERRKAASEHMSRINKFRSNQLMENSEEEVRQEVRDEYYVDEGKVLEAIENGAIIHAQELLECTTPEVFGCLNIAHTILKLAHTMRIGEHRVD